MIAALLLLSVTVKPADNCTPAMLQPHLQAAVRALQAKDMQGARAAIAPAVACPVRDPVTYSAHVLRGELAIREEDWATARTMLAGVDVHPEAGLSATAGAIRLRADQGLHNAEAFGSDRKALLQANDARLAELGKRIETFRTESAAVTSYQTLVTQGSFQRVMEFIVTPDDPGAFPQSILVTDDRAAAQIAALANKGGTQARHMWFIDLYTCAGHATLSPPVSPMGDDPPSYELVKARVIATLDRQAPSAAGADTPDKDFCRSSGWIFPGLGAKAPATNP